MRPPDDRNGKECPRCRRIVQVFRKMRNPYNNNKVEILCPYCLGVVKNVGSAKVVVYLR